eukprot:gene7077-8440_t
MAEACELHLSGGLPADAAILSSILRYIIQHEDPSILKKFKVSETWTYAFMYAIGMKPRKGTNNRKEPTDWEEQQLLFLQRLAYIVLPIKNTTWAREGADTVPLIGLDDKRQITSVLVEALGDNFEGLVVGFQLIYAGQTERYRCPRPLFVVGFTNACLFVRWFRAHSPQLQESFRLRVKAKWGWIILLYIPPGCTGRMQKASMAYSLQLAESKSPKDVTLDLSLTNMKVRQLYWIGEVYNEFKANVPARTAGWVETRIPEAFSAEMLAQARALHLAGNLFPNGRLEVVPRATSAEAAPGADTDDNVLLLEQYTRTLRLPRVLPHAQGNSLSLERGKLSHGGLRSEGKSGKRHKLRRIRT